MNLPIGIIAVLAALRVLPGVARQPADPLDVRGLGLIAAGLPLLTYGLPRSARPAASPRCG